MKKLIIGIIIGLLIPFIIDFVMFGTPRPFNNAKIYEDGSYHGCIPGQLCND